MLTSPIVAPLLTGWDTTTQKTQAMYSSTKLIPNWKDLLHWSFSVGIPYLKIFITIISKDANFIIVSTKKKKKKKKQEKMLLPIVEEKLTSMLIFLGKMTIFSRFSSYCISLVFFIFLYFSWPHFFSLSFSFYTPPPLVCFIIFWVMYYL